MLTYIPYLVHTPRTCTNAQMLKLKLISKVILPYTLVFCRFAKAKANAKANAITPPRLSPPQELRSWEEELSRAALQQKCQEEELKRREQELAEREIHILERELNIIIHQLYQEKPRVESRQGKFRRSRLKLKDGNRISLPSGTSPPSGTPHPPSGSGRGASVQVLVYTHGLRSLHP